MRPGIERGNAFDHATGSGGGKVCYAGPGLAGGEREGEPAGIEFFYDISMVSPHVLLKVIVFMGYLALMGSNMMLRMDSSFRTETSEI